MWTAVRTYALVTIVTLLIWVWAENESLTTETLAPRIEFLSTPDLVVRVDDPAWQGVVSLRLRGPTAAIDTARRQLAAAVRLAPRETNAGRAGGTTVDLQQALRRFPPLRSLGVAVVEVVPATVRLEVDEIVARRLRVKAEQKGVELDGEPTLSPDTVEVRLPAQLASSLGGNAAAIAVLDAQEIPRGRDNEPQTVRVAVRLPEGLEGRAAGSVSFEPSEVQATIRLRSRTESWTVPSVPVWVVVPPIEADRWDIRLLDQDIKGVTVTGPRELIAAMRDGGPGSSRPRAYVVLSSDDLERRIETKTAVFSLTPSQLQFAAGETTVRLKIEPRERAMPASPSVP